MNGDLTVNGIGLGASEATVLGALGRPNKWGLLPDGTRFLGFRPGPTVIISRQNNVERVVNGTSLERDGQQLASDDLTPSEIESILGTADGAAIYNDALIYRDMALIVEFGPGPSCRFGLGTTADERLRGGPVNTKGARRRAAATLNHSRKYRQTFGPAFRALIGDLENALLEESDDEIERKAERLEGLRSLYFHLLEDLDDIPVAPMDEFFVKAIELLQSSSDDVDMHTAELYKLTTAEASAYKSRLVSYLQDQLDRYLC